MHDEVWWPATRAYIVMLARCSVQDNPNAVLQENVHCNVLYVGAYETMYYNYYMYKLRQLPHAAWINKFVF